MATVMERLRVQGRQYKGKRMTQTRAQKNTEDTNINNNIKFCGYFRNVYTDLSAGDLVEDCLQYCAKVSHKFPINDYRKIYRNLCWQETVRCPMILHGIGFNSGAKHSPSRSTAKQSESNNNVNPYNVLPDQHMNTADCEEISRTNTVGDTDCKLEKTSPNTIKRKINLPVITHGNGIKAPLRLSNVTTSSLELKGEQLIETTNEDPELFGFKFSDLYDNCVTDYGKYRINTTPRNDIRIQPWYKHADSSENTAADNDLVVRNSYERPLSNPVRACRKKYAFDNVDSYHNFNRPNTVANTLNRHNDTVSMPPINVQSLVNHESIKQDLSMKSPSRRKRKPVKGLTDIVRSNAVSRNKELAGKLYCQFAPDHEHDEYDVDDSYDEGSDVSTDEVKHYMSKENGLVVRLNDAIGDTHTNTVEYV